MPRTIVVLALQKQHSIGPSVTYRKFVKFSAFQLNERGVLTSPQRHAHRKKRAGILAPITSFAKPNVVVEFATTDDGFHEGIAVHNCIRDA